MNSEDAYDPETINFEYDAERELYLSDPVSVPALKKSAVTFSCDEAAVEAAGWEHIREAVESFRSPDTDLLPQATPYVYQFYRMYFEMADEYGWEQYLPDIPASAASEVWDLVNTFWDECTVVWENDSLLLVVTAEIEWDVEHGMMLVYQNGTQLVKVGMAVESYTNPDGSIFQRDDA